MRKELSLAIIAIVLALIAVQTASLLQNPSAAALMKGASVPETSTPETSARLQIDQSTYLSLNQAVSWVVLGPLAIAAVCYLLARKRM